MTIAANIKRHRRGRVAWKLAAVAGVPSSTWYAIEAGRQGNVTTDTLSKMATALGCTVADLVRETPTQEMQP